jgi:hypothetical protein
MDTQHFQATYALFEQRRDAHSEVLEREMKLHLCKYGFL